jgi:hypothetical protein
MILVAVVRIEAMSQSAVPSSIGEGISELRIAEPPVLVFTGFELLHQQCYLQRCAGQ